MACTDCEESLELPIGPIGKQGRPGNKGNDGGTGPKGDPGEDAAPLFGTSTTSFLLATGSKTFTTNIELGYGLGTRVRGTNNPGVIYFEGIVTALSGTSLTVDVDRFVNTGTFASWNIEVTGDVGNQGIQGIQGIQGNTGAGYTATSISSNALGTGSKTFTTQTNLAYTSGARVRLSHSSTEFMEGVVSSYSGTTLIFTSDYVIGTGTFTSWNINLAGDPGSTTALLSDWLEYDITILTQAAGGGFDPAPGATLTDVNANSCLRYKIIGKSMLFQLRYHFTTTGSATQVSVNLSSIFTLSSSANAIFSQNAVDKGLNGFMLNSSIASNSSYLNIFKNAAANIVAGTYDFTVNGVLNIQ